MTEILQKAIEKAVENGWDCKIRFSKGSSIKGFILDPEDFDADFYPIVIFSHDFAKAFWGEEDWKSTNVDITIHNLPAYLWHLARLAESEDRLEYIGRFV